MICAWHRTSLTAHLPPLSNVSLISWPGLQEELNKETELFSSVSHTTIYGKVAFAVGLECTIVSSYTGFLPPPPYPHRFYLHVWCVFWYAQIIIVPAIRLRSPALLCDPCTSHTRYTSPVRPTDAHVPLVTWPAEARTGPCAVLVPLVYQNAFLSFGSETYELKSKIERPWRKFWEIKQKWL